MKAVLSNRIYLSRTKELEDKCNTALGYTIPASRPGAPPEYICDVTRVNNNILTLPIGRTDLIPEDYEIVDKRISISAPFPEYDFTLRESQQEVWDKVDDSCIIQANPSWGKTFTGIAIASTKFKQKTLIIVHNTFLHDQWIDEIKEQMGITPGTIGGKKYKYNIDSPIVIATIQSLRNRILDIRKEFGLLIVDEAHKVPATVFKGIVDNFVARYKLGLTATPWRKDGKHVMLYDYFGGKDALITTKDENRLIPTIVVVESDIMFNSNGMIPWGTRLNELYDKNEFMELFINIAEIYKNQGHLVLAVADRTEFLDTCADVLDGSVSIIGKSVERDVLKLGKNPVFGSTKLFTEGINVPPLSCLVIGVPINNQTLLDQLIGRICRPHPDKKDPIVIDIAFKGKTAKNQLSKRINYYMERGYKIKYVRV